MKDYDSILKKELIDLSIYYGESVIYENTSSLLDKVNKFYKDVLDKIKYTGTDILSELVNNTTNKLDDIENNTGSPYIDNINKNIRYIKLLKERKISRVEVYNYRKAFDEYKKDIVLINNNIKFFISIYKDEDSDYTDNISKFKTFVDEINYDIERICNRIDYINVDTAMDILVKAKSNSSDIMTEYNNLYSIIKDINTYASKVAKDNNYDKETKNKIIDALSIMTRKVVSFTTHWTNYFKNNYPLKIV